jgi:hypothetical protein
VTVGVGPVVHGVDGVDPARARGEGEDVDRRVTEVLADELEQLARLDDRDLDAGRSARCDLVHVLRNRRLVHLPAVDPVARAEWDDERPAGTAARIGEVEHRVDGTHVGAGPFRDAGPRVLGDVDDFGAQGGGHLVDDDQLLAGHSDVRGHARAGSESDGERAHYHHETLHMVTPTLCVVVLRTCGRSVSSE